MSAFNDILINLSAAAIGAVMYWVWDQYRFHRRRQQIISNGSAGEPTIINLSAHPITASEGDWAKAYKQIHIPVDLDLASPDELEACLLEIVQQFPAEARGRIQAADPALVVAFPAPRGAASLLDPILHGLCGEWVRTTWSVRTDNGFVWVRPVDRQRVRLRARSRLRGKGTIKQER